MVVSAKRQAPFEQPDTFKGLIQYTQEVSAFGTADVPRLVLLNNILADVPQQNPAEKIVLS